MSRCVCLCGLHITINVSLLNHEQTYTKGVFIKDHFRIYCPKKVTNKGPGATSIDAREHTFWIAVAGGCGRGRATAPDVLLGNNHGASRVLLNAGDGTSLRIINFCWTAVWTRSRSRWRTCGRATRETATSANSAARAKAEPQRHIEAESMQVRRQAPRSQGR